VLGQTVGSYRIEAVLGEGGMGTVYRAQHTLIGKRAAVKVLRGDYGDDDEVVQRFFNEARAAAKIEHPGIIDVYDFGRHHGRAYLVMEMLAGEPLSARLAGGPMPPDAAVRIARQIASALAAAHNHGITHRDLKPDNVFLVPDPEVTGGDRVKLLDFGIAKLVEPDAAASVETRTGAVIGTPVYMSPEQCRGAGEVDVRADLYSLGCILYQMLSGAPPFQHRGVGELITAHMTEPPEPIADRAPGTDPAIAALVMRLLEKKPQHRPASAREVVLALDGELAIEPRGSTAPQPGAHLATLLPDEAPPDTDPSPGLATAPTAYDTEPKPEATAKTGTMSTLSAAAATREAGDSEPPPGRRWPLAAAAAIAIAGALVLWLASQRSDDGGEPRATASPPAATDAAPALDQPTIGLRHLQAYRDASGSAGVLFAQPGGWASAASDFAAMAEQPGAPARWTTAALVCRGFAALFAGRKDEALAEMEQAVDREPDWVMTQLGLARALTATEQYPQALEAARRAERLAPDWWLPVAESANVHRSADRFEQAIEEYRRALSKAPGEPLVLASLSLLYHVMEMDEAAIEYAEKALAADDGMLSARLLLAERALEKGDGQTALDQAEQILARQPRSVPAKLAQGDALLALRRKREARTALERTIELVDELGPGGAPRARIAAVRKALAAGKLPRPRHLRDRKTRSRRSSKKPDRSKQNMADPLNGLDF
jgi:serine/threonine protein kinase/tetratricopeptide (TPR) repeat protein